MGRGGRQRPQGQMVVDNIERLGSCKLTDATVSPQGKRPGRVYGSLLAPADVTVVAELLWRA